uniref:NADH-ubiquinone oxidoreductase chain 2 n=1 Tax=Pseudocellus gertschi TaxID=1329481 RepID=W5R4I6_9ARAC|nr:NADH dehydrogenase subunit 2 [Pseudocellus gertschi]AGL11944.1 NADH dehydrogenase subunit 2 [Pseudocellus gertschi]
MNMFFLLTSLMLSVAMIFSSTSWFFTWMSLEINLLTFVGWVLQHKFHEAMTKYFLIQSMGSSLFIMSSSILSLSLTQYQLPQSLMILPTIAILIKMGSVPFHLWYPEVMNHINWEQCMILTTIQKFGLLFIIYQMKSNVILFALMSTIFGAMSSINQTSLRKLLAFSSISHNGWMLMCVSLLMTTWMSYFLIYSTINIIVMNLMKQMKWYHLNQIKPMNITTKMNLLLSIMALGGLPPTLGFAPKWILLLIIMNYSSLIGLILILSSLMILFAYMSMTFTPLFNIHQMKYASQRNIQQATPTILFMTLPTTPTLLL